MESASRQIGHRYTEAGIAGRTRMRSLVRSEKQRRRPESEQIGLHSCIAEIDPWNAECLNVQRTRRWQVSSGFEPGATCSFEKDNLHELPFSTRQH